MTQFFTYHDGLEVYPFHGVEGCKDVSVDDRFFKLPKVDDLHGICDVAKKNVTADF